MKLASLPTPIAIFASGRGSNFDAIVGAIQEGKLDARVVALVCDQPGAGVLEKAKQAGIPQLLIEPNASLERSERRAEHEKRILEQILPLGPRFLVMAGYMRIVTPALLAPFDSGKGYFRVVNIHPSLLPAFPGVGSYETAFQHGCEVTGVTVHLVDTGVDSGPILAQESFSIQDCGSPQEVEQRGLAVEHRLYPETLRWVLPERFVIEKRQGRISVRPN